MPINHVGHSILHIPHDSFHLKNILHVPSSSMNLIYVHKFTLDNDVFLEFHLLLFFYKGSVTRRVMCKCHCHGGLYPLVPISTGSYKHAFITIKPSSSI
jgi:hypothetical protein